MNTPTLDSALLAALELSVPLSGAGISGSIAISRSGSRYSAGYVGSKTHLLDIPSEVAVLVRALHNDDPDIVQVSTVLQDPSATVSPLVLKILIDHSTRTGTPINYRLADTSGTLLFESIDVRESLPWYVSPGTKLASMENRTPNPSKAIFDPSSPLSRDMQLRAWALKGTTRNFPIRDGASGYGCAMLTSTGEIYYGGQYSAFDNRLAIHAEMGVLLNVLMDGGRTITHIGIVSSKFPDSPCSPCGCCRQYIAEFAAIYDFSPMMCLFASENETMTTHSLGELIPLLWTN